MRNRRSKSGTSSIFKGVIKRTSTSGQVRWAASIATKDIRYNLGYHRKERLAALAYDAAAYLLFENAALYNLPDSCPDPISLEFVRERISWQDHLKSQKSSGEASASDTDLSLP